MESIFLHQLMKGIRHSLLEVLETPITCYASKDCDNSLDSFANKKNLSVAKIELSYWKHLISWIGNALVIP